MFICNIVTCPLLFLSCMLLHTFSSASDVPDNLMRKVVREGFPPRPAQAPDFEDGKDDYVDYMNMFDETITTEPLVAPLPYQKQIPSFRMNRVKQRYQKQSAQVIPMARVKKGKQMYARYKLELPVDVPLGGSRRRIARTQVSRRGGRKPVSNSDSAPDVVLRYDGVNEDGEVAKAMEMQRNVMQTGSEVDIREQIHRHEMTEYEKEAAKARKIQEDYQRQVDKYKKDLEEYYTKYPQARPANYTGPLIAAPVEDRGPNRQEQRETVAELNKNAPDKDTKYEEITEDQLHRMGLDTQQMQPAQYDPAAMQMTPSAGMQMSPSAGMQMGQMGQMGISSPPQMGMNGMSSNGFGVNGMNGMGMDMSSNMMSQPGMMNMMPGQMSMNGMGMQPSMMPGQMSMNGMGMQSSMMQPQGMSGLMSATAPQMSFMQGRK